MVKFGEVQMGVLINTQQSFAKRYNSYTAARTVAELEELLKKEFDLFSFLGMDKLCPRVCSYVFHAQMLDERDRGEWVDNNDGFNAMYERN